MSGKYSVLLDGDPGEIVHGIVCEVQGEEHKRRLQAYETDKYAEHRCNITLADNVVAQGLTFMWA